MINIFGSGADEHIELYMWLRAFTAQAQRRNYQTMGLSVKQNSSHIFLAECHVILLVKLHASFFTLSALPWHH
jgi:hypothetical protein